MQKLFYSVFLVLTMLASPGQSTVNMSLDDAINYAIKNQPALQNYLVEQKISTAKRLQAISEYLPNIAGSFSLQDNLNLPIVALKFPNPVTGLEENLKIQQGLKYQGNGGINFNVPLVDANVIGDLRYSKEHIKLTDLQLQQALIDLKVNVSKAYYLVLLNAERLKKNEKTLERDQKAYDDTKVKFDNQNAVKTDVSRAYLNLQNTKYQTKVYQDSVTTSSSNLAQLIGLPLGTSPVLTDVLPGNAAELNLPEYPDYKAAEQNRIELKTESMQESLNRLQLKKVNYGYLPTLYGFATAGGLGLDNDNLFQKGVWVKDNFIGLQLSVPIFDGLQKLAMAQQQKLAMQKNENNLNSLRQNINYQLQTSAVNYANAYENLKLIRENVKLAEDIMADVNVRYQNSLALYQEVVDAENTLKETEFTYLQAMYTYLLAELDWKKANGKL